MTSTDTTTLEALLARHQRAAMGMTQYSPDHCICGATIDPEPDPTTEGPAIPIQVRRDRAFAVHQIAAVWDAYRAEWADLRARVAAIAALIPEMEADIPEDSGNATARHIARLLRTALGKEQDHSASTVDTTSVRVGDPDPWPGDYAYCNERIPGGYTCTAPVRHVGPHVASGSEHVLAIHPPPHDDPDARTILAKRIAHAALDWTDTEDGDHTHSPDCSNWTAYLDEADEALRDLARARKEY